MVCIGSSSSKAGMRVNTSSQILEGSVSSYDHFIVIYFCSQICIFDQIQDLKKLCRQCGVDVVGFKMDLILRLRNKMSNRVTYNKVFE